MPQFDEKHVKICGGFIVWDGITQPEIVQQGAKAGSQKWTMKCVFEPSNPDLGLYDQLANKCLMESKWRGQLPQGGRMPIGQVGPDEFGGMFTGWSVISFKTTLKAPDVYDENGAPVDAMAFNQVIFTGQKVDVLAHCYDYDAAGNKGVSAGLDAFAVIQSAQAQRLQIGGGVKTADAFGGGGNQNGQNNQGGQQTGYSQNGQGNQGNQGGQQTGYSQNGQGNQGGQQTGYSQNGQGQNQGGNGQNNQGGNGQNNQGGQNQGGNGPAQAHNFLPNGNQ